MLRNTLSVKNVTKVVCVSLLALASFSIAIARPTLANNNQIDQYHVVKTITGPNIPPTDLAGNQWCVDISWYDAENNKYYLADANNKQIDVVDARTNKLLTPSGVGDFTGVGGCASFDFSRFGPAGVMTDDMNQLWVGNGNSIVHVYNKNTGAPIATVNIGGVNRAYELAYDPHDKLVVVTNPNETIPFITFISADTHQIVRKIQFPNVPQDCLEQPAYNAETNKYYMSVRTSTQNSGGEIDVLNPHTKSIDTVFSLHNCGPSGLAINHGEQEFAVGCDVAKPAQILKIQDGSLIKSIPQITGVDEVWFNPGDTKYYFGSFGIPAMGIVNAEHNFFEQNILSSDPGFHGMAASSRNHEVFMPLAGKGIVVLQSDK